ncbi:MAG: hypothetical protein ACI8TX_001092 [Hyphomicrobiaceae bacterium]|jgi:hypothetical protein
MSTTTSTTPSTSPNTANVESFTVSQQVAYNWDYDTDRERLMRLYENAKRDQWNSTDALDWSIDVDPSSEVFPDMAFGIYGTEHWNKLTKREIEQLRQEGLAWQLSQFLHGEQGALLATAQIVDAVPWYESKQYGSTQVMDEARHVEVYRRYLKDKVQHEYPVNRELKKLLDQILTESRWDMKLIGMQIIVEGLALASFSSIRDITADPLLKELTNYVILDESRHVAFGMLSLREYCNDLSEAETNEREEFIYEACVLMRDRITSREVWETMGMDADACIEAEQKSPMFMDFRYRLFSKIVPNVKSLGFLSDKQRRRFEDLGILQFENNTTSDVDQDIAEEARMQSEGAEASAA